MPDRRKRSDPEKDTRRQQDRAGSSSVATIEEERATERTDLERQRTGQVLADAARSRVRRLRTSAGMADVDPAQTSYPGPSPAAVADWDAAHPLPGLVADPIHRPPAPDPGAFQAVTYALWQPQKPGNMGRTPADLYLRGSGAVTVADKVNVLLAHAWRLKGIDQMNLQAFLVRLQQHYGELAGVDWSHIFTEPPEPAGPSPEELAERAEARRLHRIERTRAELAEAEEREREAAAHRRQLAATLAELDPQPEPSTTDSTDAGTEPEKETATT